MDDIPRLSLDALAYRSAKRAHDLFIGDYTNFLGDYAEGRAAKLACKTHDEYEDIEAMQPGVPGGSSVGAVVPRPLAITAGPSGAGAEGSAGHASKLVANQLALTSTSKAGGATAGAGSAK